MRLIYNNSRQRGYIADMNRCGLAAFGVQLDGRFFPLSDHHIRGFSVIGEAERCLQLFQQLYVQQSC